MDSVDYGPIQVQVGTIQNSRGEKMRQAKQKGGREADLFDIDTNIRPEREEEGNELRRCGEDLKVVFTDTENQLIKPARGKICRVPAPGPGRRGRRTIHTHSPPFHCVSVTAPLAGCNFHQVLAMFENALSAVCLWLRAIRLPREALL